MSGLLVVATLAGCGGSKPLPKPCSTKGLTAVARALSVSSGTVKTRADVGNNGSPECAYSAGKASVVVNVNRTPQAYFLLERTEVEATQQFGLVRAVAAPYDVPGVGLDAWWFPAESQFETTDGVNLLVVTVTIPHAPAKRLPQVGKAAAEAYLGKLVQPPGYQG